MTDKPDLPAGKPVDFDERWESFVSWMNSVRKAWPADSEAYRAEVQHHFFALLNHPSIAQKELTFAHGIKVLADAGVSSKDTGFAFFVFFVAGAIWGNRGVIPKCRDEATGLGGETTFNKDDLQ